MIYFNLENGYESFKELFGEREVEVDGKIKKVRKNKVVLNILKDMFKLKSLMWEDYFVYHKHLQFENQQEVIDRLRRVGVYAEFINIFPINYTFYSYNYNVDNNGLCYDGDINAIRYCTNDGRPFKMRASKFYSKIFTENGYDKVFGTKAMIFCAEKFAEAWCAYAQQNIGDGEYTLHVGDELDDFRKIYSVEGMDSCMTNHNQYRFYKDSVNASAAWLENKEGEIVCRCVIFNECTQADTGKIFRIAERQYAIGQDDKLKNILINQLYTSGRIDAHKRVGASCSGGWQEICDKTGSQLDNNYFSIECNLDYYDVLSYQDSFKVYDMEKNIAYNYDENCYNEYRLDITDPSLAERNYDEWADEYTNEDICSVYVHRGDSLYETHTSESNCDEYFTYVDCGYYANCNVENDYVVSINGYRWYIYDDDIVEIDGEYYKKSDCEYCEDIDDYALDFIEYGEFYYANYSYSKLIGEDIPDDLFDAIEEDYAEENGYVRDENGNWIEKVEELVEA